MFRKTWNRDLKSPGHYLAIHTSTFSWTVLQCIQCPWPSISRVLRYGLTENTVYPAHDLNGTLAWYFFVLVFCTVKKSQIIRLLSVLDFFLELADLFKFFNIRWWLSWHRVSFPVNWVNTKLDSMSTESTRSETPPSTESTRNDEIFVNIGAFFGD